MTYSAQWITMIIAFSKLYVFDEDYSYQVQDGIVYLTIAERSYPQKLAFLFLKEVADCFLEELKNSYGTSGGIDYSSKIETIENSYSFLKFGKYFLVNLV